MIVKPNIFRLTIFLEFYLTHYATYWRYKQYVLFQTKCQNFFIYYLFFIYLSYSGRKIAVFSLHAPEDTQKESSIVYNLKLSMPCNNIKIHQIIYDRSVRSTK